MCVCDIFISTTLWFLLPLFTILFDCSAYHNSVCTIVRLSVTIFIFICHGGVGVIVGWEEAEGEWQALGTAMGERGGPA